VALSNTASLLTHHPSVMNKRIMRNSSRRWKENRVREEIYKQSFKDIKASSDGAAAESRQEFQPPSNETYKY
jgi:hypothetical protein